jgi:hypothetical protein
MMPSAMPRSFWAALIHRFFARTGAIAVGRSSIVMGTFRSTDLFDAGG